MRSRVLLRPWGKAEGVAVWHESSSAAVLGWLWLPWLLPSSGTRSSAGQGSAGQGRAARKPRHPAPRSRAGSPRSGQPLYLRFPGKQFLFVTENSPALVEEGGALPPLHAKGPLLALILPLRVELKQPLLALNYWRCLFLFGWFWGFFLPEGSRGTGLGDFCVLVYSFWLSLSVVLGFFLLLNALLLALPKRRLSKLRERPSQNGRKGQKGKTT